MTTLLEVTDAGNTDADPEYCAAETHGGTYYDQPEYCDNDAVGIGTDGMPYCTAHLQAESSWEAWADAQAEALYDTYLDAFEEIESW